MMESWFNCEHKSDKNRYSSYNSYHRVPGRMFCLEHEDEGLVNMVMINGKKKPPRNERRCSTSKNKVNGITNQMVSNN